MGGTIEPLPGHEIKVSALLTNLRQPEIDPGLEDAEPDKHCFEVVQADQNRDIAESNLFGID